jgi:hypothetical protein
MKKVTILPHLTVTKDHSTESVVLHSERRLLEEGNVQVPDPYVCGPPGSGSISTMYGSGSGSFYNQAKIIRKTLIPTVLRLLYDFFYL